MVTRTKAEYGGFLPLELNDGQEYYNDYSDVLSRYNSIKSAMFFLLENISIKRIYIPYYYCPTTIKAIKSTGINVSFYHIKNDLLPDYLPDEENSAVLLVNYFGVITQEVKKIAVGFKNAIVIIDNAHAFFSEPIISNNIYQLYSAKKFFGVPDGAYLIGKGVRSENQAPGHSYEYADYLLLTYEVGTNASYKKKKSADLIIESNPGTMSVLAMGLLRNVDYAKVREKRERNFEMLHEKLGRYNDLFLIKKCAAYHYPLLITEKGREIKKTLVSRKIYVPTLWLGEDLMRNGNDFELLMSNDAIFLPIDQRYDINDMIYIADFLSSFM